MPKTKSNKERSKSIVPQAKRARSGARGRNATARPTSAVYFNPRGELVIRDARLVAKLKKKLNEVRRAKPDVASEIVVVVPPPIRPPRANTMCGCEAISLDLRDVKRVNPIRTPGRPL